MKSKKSVSRTCAVCPSLNTFSLPQSLSRFPEARVLNTYGPTETQAVTDIVVDENLAREVNPLPVGYLSDGVRALIRDPETGEELLCGEVGEIYLAGNTV